MYGLYMVYIRWTVGVYKVYMGLYEVYLGVYKVYIWYI